MAGKQILLIEPGYKNKYPPLGLMKIAQYHGPNGKRDDVRFIKGEDPSALTQAWDRIYVTTLFSFEYPKISQSIDFALMVANCQADKVFVGGIAASLMHERFLEERRWQGVRFIKGLLTGPPARALQLDDFSEELYSDDYSNTAIEDLVPDYSILSQIDYDYPVRDAYFAYTSRGCIRKCQFCGVPKLEGMQRDVESLTEIVRAIDDMYGPKKDLILMDNNVVASPRFKEIIAEIRDLGFTPGAKLTRPGSRVPVQRRVDFNQGVDARILCKDPMYLRELATICLKPLRIAFDHLGVRKPYEQAVRYAHEHGLTELSNYMLYNFHDDPADLFERMRLNVTLNEELNIRVWSFPMRFQPTNRPDRGHIGEKWSRYELRSMQIILQATHGVVSGEPTFFRRAFGDTVAEYETILMMPHDMIFNRDWYDRLDGRAEYDEYLAQASRLSPERRRELKALLSSCDPRHYHALPGQTDDGGIRSILQFYMPRPKHELVDIWRRQADWQQVASALNVPEDERVEDAGLDADEEPIVAVAGNRLRDAGGVRAPIRLAKASEVVDGGPVVVGKDVLELLSTAMYVDPLTIYREYVQNAADAIDAARADGLSAGRIDVSLDAGVRTVAIRDDATGIPTADFRRVLTSVGASGKRGSAARGFRGVGRLSGLAYARSLTFQSRAVGEAKVSTMTWNCQALRTALRDPADTRDLAAIIDAITTTTVLDEAGDPFFEVRLEGVARQGDDRVMSPGAVGDYLAEVAPVPLDTRFTHAETIVETLANAVALGDLTITINDGEPVTRPFRDEFRIEGGRPLRLREVAFVEVPSVDGGIGAVGWVAHHDYEGAIHPSTRVRGLRVRSGDVQVGEAGVLADIFPETRFDAWTVGEIHVIDPRIIPNGRRDDFERNFHLANLKNHLAPLGRDIADRCRTSSRDRKRLRDLELEQAAAREGLAVLGQGGLNAASRDKMALGVELSLMRADKLLGEPDLVDNTHRATRDEVARLRIELERLAGDEAATASPLERLTPQRRAFYEEMFGLIYENSQNRSAAKSLVDRIMAKIA